MKNNPCEKCSDRIENAVKAKRIEQLYSQVIKLEKVRDNLCIWLVIAAIFILILIGVVSG